MALSPASGTVAYLQRASLIASGMLLNPTGYVATRLLPVMPVAARQGFYYKETAGGLSNLVETRRTPSSAFARIDFPFSSTSYETEPHGVEIGAADEHMAEFNPQFGGTLNERMVMHAVNTVLRKYENIVATQFFNTGNYAAGTGTGFAAAQTWANSAGTPVSNVLRCINEIKANGYYQTDASDFGIIIPEARARDAFKSPELRSTLGGSYTQPGQAVGIASVQEMATTLAKAFGVGEVLIANGGYRSGGTEAAPTNSALWTETYGGVYLRSQFDAGMGTFFKGLGATFSWSEMAPAVAGAVPAPVSVVQYRENPVKSEIIQVSSDLKMTVVNSNAFMLMTGLA